jgi:hypothetical protein
MKWIGLDLRPADEAELERRIVDAAAYYYNQYQDSPHPDLVTSHAVIGVVTRADMDRAQLPLGEILEARVRAYLRWAESVSPEALAEAHRTAQAVRTAGGGTIIHFGPRWDMPMLDFGAIQVPTPLGEECYLCEDPIAAGDRGLLRGLVRQSGATIAPVHLECDMFHTIGHSIGVCHCTGWGYNEVMRKHILAVFNQHRAQDGQGPL